MALSKLNFDLKKLITWLLPSFKRGSKMVAWLYTLTKHLRDLHSDFLFWAEAKQDDIQWNAQTMVLEQLLIRTFGQGIYIENHIVESVIIYTYPIHDSINYISYPVSHSNNPLTYPIGTFDPDNLGFTVWVPDDLTINETRMRAVIDRRKMVGTGYTIKYYTP